MRQNRAVASVDVQGSIRGRHLNRSWHEPLDGRRVPSAAALAALVAAGINVGLREAAARWLGVPSGQAVLSLTVVLAATVGGVALATLALVLLAATQARPFTIFRRVAWVAFLLVSAAAVLAYLGWLPRVAAVSYGTMLVLVGMNAVTTISCIAFLTTLPRVRPRSGCWA